MILYGWRTREDGTIVTWDLPSGPERVVMLPAEQRQAFDVGSAKYRELHDAAAKKYGLPDGLLDASAYRESGFNERAYRVERKEDGTPIYRNGRLLTGVGLHQLTDPSIKGNRTDEQLFDPALNIEIAARHYALLLARYGNDAPRLFAAYNAGSARVPSPGHENPWNLHQTRGHVSTEVAALNYYIARRRAREDMELKYLEEVAVSQQFDLRPDVATLPPPADEEAPPTPRNDVPDFREAVTVPDTRKRES